MTDHRRPLPTDYLLKKYRIKSVLGSGGFGITYYAIDTDSNKPVAIKEYLPKQFALRIDTTTVGPKSPADQDQYQQCLDRFCSEPLALARCKNPHINKVKNLILANDTAYIVLEYIEGETLSKVLERDGRLDAPRLRRLLDELLSGLEAVHGEDLVHRDIKPDNIMLRSDGSAVLLDFGTARQTVEQSSESISTRIYTPGYAAIEQHDGKAKDLGPWTDLYALGMIAYRCITGLSEPGISDAKTRELRAYKGKPDLAPAVEAGKGRYEESLLQAVDWAFRVDKDQRPQSVAELREALAGGTPKAARDTAPPLAKVAPPSDAPTPAPEPTSTPAKKKGSKKKRRFIALAIIFLLMSGAALGLKKAIEPIVWNAAQCDNKASVRNYLRFYPNGRHSVSARICLKETGKPLRIFRSIDGGIGKVAFSPNEIYVISSSWDVLRLWDVQTGKSLRTFKGHTAYLRPWAVAFSPNGKYVISGSYDETLRLWSVKTGISLRTFKGHTNAVLSVAFSPDGKTVISGSEDKTLRLWDVHTGKSLHIFHGHMASLRPSDVAFSLDGIFVISSGFDNKTLRLWDVYTGKSLHTFQGHTNAVLSVAFSPDGKTVISGSEDKTLRLWDVQTGKSLRTFRGHTDEVNSVAFSPNGKYVISGSEDRTLRLWEVQTGKSLRTFRGHTDEVNSVAFSPNGKYVISAGVDDGDILRLWDIHAR